MITRTPPSLREFAPGLLGQAVAEALQAQAALTAVDRFSKWHEGPREAAPDLEPWYRDLLPLQAPGPGEQYAFEVNLDRCSGCKACVTACHSLNGLDDGEGESFRDVGLLLDPDDSRGPQHITSACHHCLDPECSNGCPVLAYEKEADTGVVRHLDDQCIGCEYCVLKCPYDVPKYHHGKGIVRKCDLCVGRLRAGEAPACVQACPTKAIRIAVVSAAPPGAQEPQGFDLPGAPDPKFTRPTTRFISSQPLPAQARSADAGRLRPEKTHAPLATMLVVSQVAFGFTWSALAWKHALGDGNPTATWIFPVLSLAIMALALLISLAHLGRPSMAWKAWLNWRRSWLSREVLAFSAFAGAASTAAALALVAQESPLAAWVQTLFTWSPLPAWRTPSALFSLPTSLPVLGHAVDALAGITALAALGASAMVYIDTPRALWRRSATAWRFGLTALSGGPALAAVMLLALHSTRGVAALWLCAALAQAAKMLLEASDLRHLRLAPPLDPMDPRRAKDGAAAAGPDRRGDMLRHSMRLLLGPQIGFAWARIALGLSGMGMALFLSRAAGLTSFSSSALFPIALATAAALFAADMLERRLFFTTAAAPRMPGAF